MNIDLQPLLPYQAQPPSDRHPVLRSPSKLTLDPIPCSSNSNSSPSSPAQSVASSSVHSSIHPPNSLANLSISNHCNLQQQQSHSIVSHSTAQTNSSNQLGSTLVQQPDPSIPINSNPSHLHNRSIPPPLTLLSNPFKSEDQSTSQSEDLMTARCSQFPIDTLEPRHSTLGSSRFQPYLPPLPTDPSAWSSDSKSQSNPPRALFHPSQLSPSHFTSSLDDSPLSSHDLHSSCSSLASSTKSSQSSTYFPSTNLPFQDSSSTSAVGGPGDVLYPPLGPPGFSQTAVYPAYTGPTSRPSLGLPYPAAAFTPSGGSPPIASASSTYFHFDSAGAGRRHTVSSFASPMPIDLSLAGNPELDENVIKEEKRRRNKESSQRFRDRTRERQREKQERLEYLERRTKELENQLKIRPRSDDMQDDNKSQDSVNHNAERETNEKLWAENETLRSLLKKANDEINRLQLMVGTRSPHSPMMAGPYYAALAQLSPAASTDLTHGSQASSPAGEQSYFAVIPRGTSPASDTASKAQRVVQAPVAQPGSTSFSPAARCGQLEQQIYHSHQSIATTPNEFWERPKDSGSLVPGWQAADHQ